MYCSWKYDHCFEFISLKGKNIIVHCQLCGGRKPFQQRIIIIIIFFSRKYRVRRAMHQLLVCACRMRGKKCICETPVK